MKIIPYLCLLLLLTAVVACGAAATPTALPVAAATPTALPVAATPPPPTAIPTEPPTAIPTERTLTATPPSLRPTPTAQPATATPLPLTETVAPTERPPAATRPTPRPTVQPPTEALPLPTVEIPADHPAAALAMLPGALFYAYINLETVSQRPGLKDHVEFRLGHFVSRDELPFAQDLLISVGVRALALSSLFTNKWACILWGDFGQAGDALREAAASGSGLSVNVVDTHREVEIYVLVRTRDSGYESEIYLAVPTGETLAASPNLDNVRNMIDRHIDGGQLPEDLAAMVEDWGLSDILEVFLSESRSDHSSPIDASRTYAMHATLADGSATIVRALLQFQDEEQATTATSWINEQTEPRWRNIGWGESTTIDQWRHKGSTVYGEVTLFDEDLPGLMQGN